MNLSELPIISTVFESGPDNRVFDSLLLLGPLVIGFVIVLDRSPVTEAVAVAYIGVFITYVLYRGVGKR